VQELQTKENIFQMTTNLYFFVKLGEVSLFPIIFSDPNHLRNSL
jgi:hypothetical protein